MSHEVSHKEAQEAQKAQEEEAEEARRILVMLNVV